MELFPFASLPPIAPTTGSPRLYTIMQPLTSVYLKPVYRYTNRHVGPKDRLYHCWALIDGESGCTVPVLLHVQGGTQKITFLHASGRKICHSLGGIRKAKTTMTVFWPSGTELGRIEDDQLYNYLDQHPMVSTSVDVDITGAGVCFLITEKKQKQARIAQIDDCIRLQFLMDEHDSPKKLLILAYAMKVALSYYNLQMYPLPKIGCSQVQVQTGSLTTLASLSEVRIRVACIDDNLTTYYELLDQSGHIALVCQLTHNRQYHGVLFVRDRVGVLQFYAAGYFGGDSQDLFIFSYTEELIGIVTGLAVFNYQNHVIMNLKHNSSYHYSFICTSSFQLLATTQKVNMSSCVKFMSPTLNEIYKAVILCHAIKRSDRYWKLSQTVVPKVKSYIYKDRSPAICPEYISRCFDTTSYTNCYYN